MIDAALQAEIEHRLDKSGVFLYRRESADGANVESTTEVPWGPALMRLMQITGFGIGIHGEEEPKVLPLRLEE